MSKIKIFQTSDIHGNIFPTNYVDYRNHGLSLVANLIKENSQDCDDTLIIDSGDLIQGNSLAFYAEKHKDINPSIIEALNTIGYDCVTFGNHEFNFGLEYLYNHYNKFQGDLITANIQGLELPTKPYKIYEFGTMRIAVIGLTTDFVPRWEKAEHIEGIKFLSPIEQYRLYEPEMLKQSDFIIVNYHGGFELSLEDNLTETEPRIGENIASQLITEFNSIDLMLTGHQHREIATKVNNTVCMQPSCNGQYVSCITIDTNLKEITDYQLISSADYQEDEKISNYFAELNTRCNKYLDTPLTILDTDLKINDVADARLNSHPFLSLLGDIFTDYMPADVVALSLFDSAIGFEKEVTIRQVNQNYPFPNSIVKIAISGAQIIEAITQSNNYYTLSNDEISIDDSYIFPKLKHFNYDMFYGVSYTVLVNENTNEIVNVKINQENLEVDKIYTMLVSNYRYNNISDYPVFSEVKKLDESTDDAIEIILNYLDRHQEIKIINKMNYQIKKGR